MKHPPAPPALQQFVDDEMLRAPLLFDQVVDGTLEAARKALGELKPVERSIVGDLMQALLARRTQLGKHFVESLQVQMQAELGQGAAPAAYTPAPPQRALTLSLVDEESVAVDVQLSHTIEAIKSVAEYELRELQTFVSALVGDMDVAREHNPLRPEVYARALWSAAQVLPLSRGHQVFFMRHAAQALAQVLRRSYAAASSRLEAQGIEPAAYRTLILPAGSRRGGRSLDTGYVPDLHGMRSNIDLPLEGPATSRSPLSFHGQTPESMSSQRWRDVATEARSVADRQSVELISRLFDAIAAEERLPEDMKALLARLHGPAMRLTLRDGSTLDKDDHPLWRFVNRLAHEAQMAPDLADPERAQLLKIAQATIDQLASEPEQKPALYQWALERLDAFLQQRLARRLTRTASQIGALQKLEDRIVAGQPLPTTLSGALDVPQLDTVPSDLLGTLPPAGPPQTTGDAWLDALHPGAWVRMFLQGRWRHAQLLWPGERREIWLFGDGASDATWAVRRRALVTMHAERLLKGLSQRSLLSSAAERVQKQASSSRSA